MTLFLYALLALAPPAERAIDPVATEKRMGEVQLEFDSRTKAKDWEGALHLIRRAARLDPDHPKPYLLAVLLSSRRGALEQASGIMESLGPAAGPGRIYGDGSALFMGDNPAAAAAAFKRALDLFREKDHAAGQAACHTALGNVERKSSRLHEAMTAYEAAVPLLSRIGDRLGMADIQSNLAKLEREAGRPRKAAERQRDVLKLREELGDEAGQSRSWHEIGVSLFQAEDSEGAMEALGHALSMRGKAGDRAAEASTLRVMGEIHLSAGRDRQALQAFRTAASDEVAVNDRRSVAGTKSWIGRTLRRLGEFEGARETLQSALDLAVEFKDAKLQAAILTDLAAVQVALWNVADALVAGERALELNRQQGNKRGELTNGNTLGAIYHALGETARARRHVEAALQLAQELSDDSEMARGHNNLGVLLADDKDFGSALNELRQAEALWGKIKDAPGAAAAKANMAEVLISQRQVPQAEGLLSAALETFRISGDRLGQASASNQIASLRVERGQARQAIPIFRETIESAGRFGLAEEEWRARAGLASSLEALGRRDDAIAETLLALDAVERARARMLSDTFKIRFFAGRIPLYEQALSLLLGEGGRVDASRAGVALGVMERARARGLSDLLVESRARLRDSVPLDLRKREEQALDGINAATVRLLAADGVEPLRESRLALGEAEEALQRVEIEMRTSVPRYAGIVYPQPPAAAAIQAILGEDEVLMEYFIGARHAWVWEVRRQGISVRALPAPAKIRDAVASFADNAGSPGAALSGKKSDAGAEWLAGVLAPASRGLAGKRLLIVPDGPLHHLPFEALSRKGRFLIEDHEITIVPSATALLLMRARPRSPIADSFLGVGDPLPGEAAMPALPFSRVEVERVAGHFEEPSRTVLTGAGVSRTSMKTLEFGKFGYVHFATHGLMKTGEGRTGLWLGGAPNDGGDSILTSQDVLTLRMSAGLVVLSACQSGLGELIDGEGLVSLTRAFLYAGSRSVVVALWNVNDASTVDFMEEFYEHLRSGEPPATALRSAKLSFIRSDRPVRREPYRWAPFIMVGEPSR